MNLLATQEAPQKKPWLSLEPSPFQQRILRVLREHGKPLSTAELSKRVGLVGNKARGYCGWLVKNELVETTKRYVIREIAGRKRKSPEVFWRLTDKGHEYLSSKDQSLATTASTV
jgi:predicted ArsR family transcriptional regulator